MKKYFLFYAFILNVLFQNISLARHPVTQLMPPQNFTGSGKISTSPQNQANQNSIDFKNLIGIEFGAVGRRQTTKSDAMGMQFLLGGRIIAILPIFKKIFIKPSLGYFTRTERLAGLSVEQTNFEAGATLNYSLLARKNLNLLCGISQKLNLSYSTITILNSSGKTPTGLLYRLGPATELIIGIGSGIKIVADLEINFTLFSPTVLYSGMTAGVVFEL